MIDTQRAFVVEQVLKAMAWMADKDLVMCPYNPKNHWVLVILSVKNNKVWYLDSAIPKDPETHELHKRDFGEVIAILNE